MIENDDDLRFEICWRDMWHVMMWYDCNDRTSQGDVFRTKLETVGDDGFVWDEASEKEGRKKIEYLPT